MHAQDSRPPSTTDNKEHKTEIDKISKHGKLHPPIITKNTLLTPNQNCQNVHPDKNNKKTCFPRNDKCLPKLLVLNACSIKKINSTNQKGCSLLAQDLKNLNIDVAIVTETFLRPSIPDSFVTIPQYRLLRRDRVACNCRRRDCSKLHKGGGVVIYYLSSYICDIHDSAESVESFWVKLSPPNNSSGPIFINATYHPPNADGKDLIEYLSNSIQNILLYSTSSTILIGGDFNRLCLNEFLLQFCLADLDAPPSRGDAKLDLLLTNRPDLIESTQVYKTELSSDHLAIIMSPLFRSPPTRKRISFTDYSFKGFQKFNELISTTDFSPVFYIADVNKASQWLDHAIRQIVQLSFHTRTVTVSDRDPAWLTPKCKWLLSKKKKAIHKKQTSIANDIDSKLKNQKISFFKINKSKQFWNNIDQITNRKANSKSICSSLIDTNTLNTELANRSAQARGVSDSEPTHYAATQPLPTASHPLQLELSDVVNVMRKCKKTSQGPSNIPFFVFKDFWDIIAPLFLHIWNLSLKSGIFPAHYKRANLIAIPKTKNAKSADEIRGISITPIAARLFEKAVHRKWILPNIIHLGDPLQFAYRPKLSTVDCLLTLQHFILRLLDQPYIDGVHIIAIDFSKAFDRLNQTIASRKFPRYLHDTILCNWLFDFCTNRSQRLCWNGEFLPFLNIDLGCSQGTVGGPNIFSIFTDDCQAQDQEAKIIKYSDDSSLLVPCFAHPSNQQKTLLSNEFKHIQSWSKNNEMSINTSKSNHLRFCLNHHPICSCDIPQLDTKTHINILGVTFQTNGKFNIHCKTLLSSLRRTLFVIKDLKLNSFSTYHIDQVFEALIVSRIRYCISVYGSDSKSILKIDKFLDSCFRHHYCYTRYSASDILQQEDARIAINILQNPLHPLHDELKKHKTNRTTRHNFSYMKHKTNTLTFSHSFCNRVLPL